MVHTATCEVAKMGLYVLQKHIPMLQTTPKLSSGCNILGIQWTVFHKEEKPFHMKSIDMQYRNTPWRGVVTQDEIKSYMHGIGYFKGYLHTEYKPTGGV